MKKFCAIIAAGALLSLSATSFAAEKAGSKLDGKKLFETNCASCHKDGGNTVNPQKTLKKADLKKNGVKKPEDIVKLMRSPGPGMTAFDAHAIPDKEAKAIAEYVMKSFK
jgi:cytochrome c6